MNNDDYTLVESLTQKTDRLNNSIDEFQDINVVNNSIIGKIDNSINDVNKDIKKINNINRKRICIRNIKIFKNILKLLLHPFLALCVSFSLSYFIFNDLPFVQQDRVNTMRYETIIDNQGNMSTDNHYDDTNWFSTPAKKKNTMIFKYGKWKKIDKGYGRDYDGYVIGNLSLEQIKELFDNPDKIDELYANSKTLLFEEKDEITDEELNQENYIKAIIHYEDTDDYYISPQNEEENIRDSVTFLVLLFGSGLFASSNVKDIIEKRQLSGQGIILEDYKKIDIDDIKKQFHEKRIAFERTQKQLKKELSNQL